MNSENIYIVLTNTSSVLSKIIKFYTKKPYNHASISFNSELTEVYSFGRKRIRNPFVGGFVQEDVTKGLFTEAECAIYSMTVTASQFRHMKQYVKEIEKEQDEYQYNFLGLFGFLMNRPIERKKAFFCSQFVASVLEKSGEIDFNKPLSLISPDDLKHIPSLRLEYEGKLNGYPTMDIRSSVHVSDAPMLNLNYTV